MLALVITILAKYHGVLSFAFLLVGVFVLFRAIFKQDRPAGIAVYLVLVVIADEFFETGIPLLGIEHGTIKYSEVIWLFLLLRRGKSQLAFSITLKRRAFILFSLMMLLLFLSAVRTDPILDGIWSFRRQVLPQIFAFVLAIEGFDTEAEYIQFFNYLVFFVFFIAFFNILLEYAGIVALKGSLLDSPTFSKALEYRRYGSIFGNPNYLGLFTVLLMPIYIFLSLSCNNRRRRYLYFFVVFVLLGLLAQTRSRGPVVAISVSSFFFILLLLKKSLKSLKVFLVFTLLLLLVFPEITWRLTTRIKTQGLLTDLSAQSAYSRTRVGTWTTLLTDIISENPWGIPLRGYLWDAAARHNRFILDNPHNSYLEIALYGGIPALGVFLMLLFMVFINTSRRVLQRDPGIEAGIFFGLVGFSIGMIVEPVLFRPRVANMFWILTSFAVSFSVKEKSTSAN